MEPALTLAGWLAAAVAASFALLVWRSRADRMESVARVCHELRGPITAARLGLQLGARTAELSPARLRAIDLELGRAALALEDLSALRGRPQLTRGRGEVDVADLLVDSVEASRASAEERGVELEVRWWGRPAYVWGDRFRLAQATRNLIANAIEHGGDVIEVRGRAEGTGVRVEVIDGGPGLPAPVAELAQRAHGGRGRRGRGLAIAAAIAEDHGGRLAAAPSERGARLVLDLPAATREAPASPVPGEG
jgi:signal transduction histidine kinase